MTYITMRTSVRALALSVSLGAAALAVSGGVTHASTAVGSDRFLENGATTGAAYAVDGSRIVATSAASWGFDAPTVVVVPPPKAIAKSHAASNRVAVDNPTPPSVAGNAILEFAATFVGVPYLAGGTTPDGFDCTGFVTYVYANFGISLPRVSSSYWNIGTRVSAADALPGDLIVSSGHVGIYAGGNMQIDSPRPGKTIQFRAIWQNSYIFVRVS